MRPPRSLLAVDLRDEAVRVLRRAVEHVQLNDSYTALQIIRNEGCNWWDEAQHVPSVVAFGTPSLSLVEISRVAGGGRMNPATQISELLQKLYPITPSFADHLAHLVVSQIWREVA